MTQVGLGPYNITYGNSAYFTAEFFDDGGNLTVPSGATLSLTYTNINNTEQIDSISLQPNNSFFNGTWSSSNAALGLVVWTIVAAGFSSASQMGIIRVIDP